LSGTAIKCWGQGTSGQLGNGITANSTVPASVSVAGAATVLAIFGVREVMQDACSPAFTVVARDSAGNPSAVAADKTIALTDTGSATFYSDAACTVAVTSLPLPRGTRHKLFYVRDAISQNTTISASASGLTTASKLVRVSSLVGGQVLGQGQSHGCAVVAGGVQCWGDNTLGKLGDGTVVSRATPVWVAGLGAGSGASAVFAGPKHSCAIVHGAAKCWGANVHGQLGNNTLVSSSVPVDVSGLTSGVSALAPGTDHTCAIHAGVAKCWGFEANGRLGNGAVTSTDQLAPVNVIGLSEGASSITAGSDFSCAVVSGGAQCWGNGAIGQVGNSGSVLANVPRPVSVDTLGWGRAVESISSGSAHSCATVGGAIRCWGVGANGKLGNGATTSSVVPVAVSGIAANATLVSAGTEHTCAVVNGGSKCWGKNLFGSIGDGTSGSSNTPRLAPTDVIGQASGVLGLEAGEEATCAIVANGTVVRCWGRNANSRLGDGTILDRPTPVDIAFSP
jgi:alpha-tubulin suppressor-like RCC1 family protein